jgi:hypothetical protein
MIANFSHYENGTIFKFYFKDGHTEIYLKCNTGNSHCMCEVDTGGMWHYERSYFENIERMEVKKGGIIKW